jgi:hypothetical protein
MNLLDYFGDVCKPIHVKTVNSVALLDLFDVDCFLKDDLFDVSVCIYCTHYDYGRCDCEDEWLVD